MEGSKEILKEIEVVYEPRGKPAEADLIFIHGIGHDWKQTWRCNTAGTTWVEYQLPTELSTLRMGCWGCALSEPSRLDVAQIQSIAEELLKALQKYRKNVRDRPVIFMAHSFGGVILKQALVDAFRSETKSLLQPVVGIVFLSVPIKFLTEDSWHKFLSNICSSDRVVQDRIFPPRDLVAHIHGSFDELRGEFLTKTRIYSICESLPVYRIGVLVPPELAIIPGHNSKIIVTDHFSITVLDRNSDPLYHWLCDWLRAILHSDTQTIERLEKDLPQEPQKLLVDFEDAPDERDQILSQPPDYPDVKHRISYALLLEDKGYHASAETAWNAAIKACQPLANPNLILFCRDKLIYNYWCQGKYGDAETEHKALERLREKHSQVRFGRLTTKRNKVLILRSKGDFQEAFQMLVRSLEETKSTESSHLNHLPNLHLLAVLLNDLGYSVFSEYLFKEVIQECHTQLGSEHPYTLKCTSDLSVVFAIRGELQEANKYNLRAYKGLELRYGMNHPAVIRAAKRHAMNMLHQGEYYESCKAFEDILTRFPEKLVDTYPSYLSTMSGLAAAYVLRGSIGRGKRLLQRAHTLQKKHLGEGHRATIWSWNLLESLDGYNFQDRVDHPTINDSEQKINVLPDSIYQHKFETSLRKMSGNFVGKGRIRAVSIAKASDTADPKAVTINDKSNLMPPLDLPTGTKESKYRKEVFKGTTRKVSNDLLKSYAHNTSSFFGGLIHIAAYSDDRLTVQRLLRLNIDVNQRVGIFQTPMKAAIMRGNMDIIKELLNHQNSSKPINSLPSLGPIYTAIFFDKTAAVKLLLDRNDLPSSLSIYGEPLLQVVEDVNIEVTEILLKKNHDPQFRSGLFNKNPLEEVTNKAQESLALSQNNGDNEKYQKFFEKLLTVVLENKGIEGETLKNLGPAEKKEIESLRERVLIAPEDLLPIYEPEQPYGSQAKLTDTNNSPNPIPLSRNTADSARETETKNLTPNSESIEKSLVLESGLEGSLSPEIIGPPMDPIVSTMLPSQDLSRDTRLEKSKKGNSIDPTLEENVLQNHNELASSSHRRLKRLWDRISQSKKRAEAGKRSDGKLHRKSMNSSVS